MDHLQEISNSMQLLKWGTKSNSFDGMDIRLTRPGFGVVLLIKPDHVMQNLRKSCENLLLMRTRDCCLHMTVFQVFLMFRRDYEPSSLPNNLLEALHSCMKKAIQQDIMRMNEELETLCVGVTNNWLLLGKDFPSHLVIQVQCKEVCNVLQHFKEKVNSMGYQWMNVLAKELRERNLKGSIEQGEIGSRLSSNGWDLIIGYTSNPDYKTHITMGILPTTDLKVNEALLQIHAYPERTIDVAFSSEEGNREKDNMIRSMRVLTESFRMKELQKLDEESIGDYPTLKARVIDAKSSRPLVISKSLIDEWGKMKMKTINEKLAQNQCLDKNACLNVSKIHMSILNMECIQNFEPQPPRSTTEQGCVGVFNMASVQSFEQSHTNRNESCTGELTLAYRP